MLGQQVEKAKGGETVRAILDRLLAERLDLRCKTLAGLWSEDEGRELDRHAFLGQTPSWLLDAARQGSDAAGDDDALLRLVQQQMAVVWADLRGRLPPERDAETLGRDSRRAAHFRQAVVKLFTCLAAGQIVEAGKDHLQVRASLASQAGKLSAKCQGGGGVWQQIAPPLLAWWRKVAHEGEVVDELAFRLELAGQVGVQLPGVTTPDDLITLGTRYGALARSEEASQQNVLLGVLSRELTASLLAVPQNTRTA
jgi:hypothetical protein